MAGVFITIGHHITGVYDVVTPSNSSRSPTGVADYELPPIEVASTRW